MNHGQLKKLREDTDAAIEVVRARRPQVQGAINWADLHCLQAAWVLTDDEENYAEVTIEEASPDAGYFQRVIAEELARAGWPDIRVVTEW